MYEKHKSFWDFSEQSEPLIDYFIDDLFPLRKCKDLFKNGNLTPENIVTEEFISFHKRWETMRPELGELVRTFYPFWPIPWMEGIMGCPMKVSLDTLSIAADQITIDLKDIKSIRDYALDPENKWFAKLLDYQKFLIKSFGNEGPIGFGLMRGPIDMASAMLGGERLVFELIDHPPEIRSLLDTCTEVFIATAKAQAELFLPFSEYGYSTMRCLFQPNPSPVLQEDNVAFLSPTLYKEFIRPLDQRILAEFENMIFHTHTSSIHIILDDLLSYENLKAIDTVWDLPPFGPPIKRLLPTYHRIQEQGKSLYILAAGYPTEEELLTLSELSPHGLCIFFQASDETAGSVVSEKLISSWN
jgi:hypothetical protein